MAVCPLTTDSSYSGQPFQNCSLTPIFNLKYFTLLISKKPLGKSIFQISYHDILPYKNFSEFLNSCTLGVPCNFL